MSAENYEIVERAKNELLFLVSQKFCPEDYARVEEALLFAEDAHRGQRRRSGEPYIIHPIAVARILTAEFGLNAEPVIAGLLHDVVEDTPHTLDEIKNRFGEDVANLVDVVTKHKQPKYRTSKQVDNFVQMLGSLNYDIRAILIKLADRLHNMRTLKSMKFEKQLKIAAETDFFYAPLANRLGLYLVKNELENLSLQYRSPREYALVEQQRNDYVRRHADAADLWIEPIRAAFIKAGISASVRCVPRSVYSLWYRMHQRNVSFKELDFIRIVTICYDSEPDIGIMSEKEQALRIYSIITSLYTEQPQSLTNYIDTPKENGYRSLHFKVMGNEGRWMEVHIQSLKMQEQSSRGCLAESQTGQVQDWIDKFSVVLHDLASQNRGKSVFDDVVTSFYHDDIVVFSNKGEKITLPKGACALDFAYEVHTELGDNAKYALINDHLCSILTPLKRGDRVTIGKDPAAVPKAEYLNYTKTYKARKSIRSYLRKIEQQSKHNHLIRCDKCNPLPGEELLGFRASNGKITVHKRNCPIAISMSSQQGDIIEAVDLPVSKDKVYPATFHIMAVNRNNFLLDLMENLSSKWGLSIDSIESYTKDEIVDCKINLFVHSIDEIENAANDIQNLPDIYEVRC